MTASTTIDDLTLEDVLKARATIEYYHEQGWTDGLPVIPPVQPFVDEMLARTERAPSDVVYRVAHLEREVTVEKAAINAVMAGCLPEHFPILLAALSAFTDVGHPVIQSTTGQCQVIIVNGPIRDAVDLNYRGNILGPGHRANASIGRAFRLIIMNALDVRPHFLDQATHGTPGKYAFCFGEHEEESPWEPLHVEMGFAAEESTASIHVMRNALHVEHRSTQAPEEILLSIADSMSYTGSLYEAPPYNRNNSCIVIMGPEHAHIVAGQGWSKGQVRQFLWEHWGRTVGELRRVGKVIDIADRPDDEFIHYAPTPESIRIVVSGAANAGVSTVVLGFVSRWGTRVIEQR